MKALKFFPKFIIDDSAEGFLSIYSHDGTCLYVRLPSGVEVFNSTEYHEASLIDAQRATAEHVELSSLSALFVDNARAGINAGGLALLAFATQIVACCTESAKVVDGGLLEAVKA